MQTVDDTETFTLTVENIEDGILNTAPESAANNLQSSRFKVQSLIVPFDIYKDSLFHIRLLKDAEHFYFFLDIHHLIGDGTTLKVMLADFG